MNTEAKQDLDDCCDEHKPINIETEHYAELSDDEKIDIVARNVMQRFKTDFMVR